MEGNVRLLILLLTLASKRKRTWRSPCLPHSRTSLTPYDLLASAAKAIEVRSCDGTAKAVPYPKQAPNCIRSSIRSSCICSNCRCGPLWIRRRGSWGRLPCRSGWRERRRRGRSQSSVPGSQFPVERWTDRDLRSPRQRVQPASGVGFRTGTVAVRS